jgi:RHS repeat-associated protein
MNLGYTGKPYDSRTELYNYGYRDYEPGTARFTTVDPVRDGSNWFVYVNNDPVNWVDPWGLDPVVMWDRMDAGNGGASQKRGVDLNMFPPDTSDSKIRTSATITLRPTNTFVVAAHGNQTTLVDENNRPVTPSRLAAIIKNDSKYQSGISVTLFSCNTGQVTESVKIPYAQQLADALGPGSIVIAPNDTIWLYSNGREPVIAPYKDLNDEKIGPDLTKQGQMVTFTGRNKGK